MSRLSLLVLMLTCASSLVADPLVIAHRGASAYLPEHTLPAVAMAHAMGADYIEQDVVLSRDEVPIILHDVVLEHTTDVAVQFPGRARADGHYYVTDFSLAEIKQLQVGERRDDRMPLSLEAEGKARDVSEASRSESTDPETTRRRATPSRCRRSWRRVRYAGG